MASADFSEDSEEKRPTVQVGDPFTEKLLIEACLELMASDAIVAIQDMGAAGLTSSSVEMASKGGVGIRLDMNKVPCREDGMTPYEMMLSESQERMLMVLKPGREAEAEAIFRKWELDFAVIGQVTDTGRMELVWNGETVADIPLGPLADDAPEYDRPHLSLDEYKVWARVKPLDEIPGSTDIAADLLKLMASPNLASRRWVWEQYDQSVGADTVQRPGGDAAVVRVHGSKKALAITTDCTPRYCYADPYEGGKQAVAEAYRNLCAVGARPLAITNCLNFGNPQRPEIMAQFVECLRGMGEACRALDFPVVSGNVSLFGDSGACEARELCRVGFISGGEENPVVWAQAHFIGEAVHAFLAMVLRNGSAPFAALSSGITEAREALRPCPFVHVVEELAALLCGRRRGDRTHDITGFDNLGEQAESGPFEMIADLRDQQRIPEVRLVRAICEQRFFVRNARIFAGRRDGAPIGEFLEHTREHRLDRGEHVVLGDEAHLEVELIKLARAPVRPGILVAEAGRDLEITVEARDHDQLLEHLRRLREGVEFPRMHPAGYEIVALPSGELAVRIGV